MDFIEKLDLLMSEKGLNKHTFSKQCGIPYTTVDAFYKKGTDNVKLSTLRKIAAFFDVSLDYIGDDEITDKQANWIMEGLSESPLSSNSIPVELKRGVFADNVNKYMLKNNIGQKDICELLGVEESTVSKWLDGDELPDVKTIDALADFLRVKRNDLLDKKSTKYSNQEKKTISIKSSLSESELAHIKKYRRLSENNKQAVNITIDTLLRAQDAEISKEFHPDAREKAI